MHISLVMPMASLWLFIKFPFVGPYFFIMSALCCFFWSSLSCASLTSWLCLASVMKNFFKAIVVLLVAVVLSKKVVAMRFPFSFFNSMAGMSDKVDSSSSRVTS